MSLPDPPVCDEHGPMELDAADKDKLSMRPVYRLRAMYRCGCRTENIEYVGDGTAWKPVGAFRKWGQP